MKRPHEIRELGPWLTEEQAMKHVPYGGSVRAFREVCRRMGIPFGKFGRARRYRQGVLDWAIENGSWKARQTRGRRRGAVMVLPQPRTGVA